MARLPAQTEIALPLLAELEASGGRARPGELYDRIAARMNLDDETRNMTVDAGRAGTINAWERHVRWTRQTLVLKDLISRGERGVWELTERANAKLHNIVRGTIVTVFQTANGIALWADATDAIGCIEKQSLSLIFTSPPYPLARPKEYDNLEPRAWLDWMLRLCEGWRELLADDGSLILNIGPTWIEGSPQQSLHVERLLVKCEDELGLSLCQRLDWHSPNRLGALEWVGIRRIRVRPSVEPLLWLAPSPSKAKANNANVLVPYSKAALRAIANPQDGTRTRPSGHRFGPSSFRDVGGAIPPSLLVASNSDSASAYRRAERAAGRTPHPATMPESIVEFAVRLTTDPGDVVYDPFLGSATTASVAERLGRRWIGSERSRHYLDSARIRLEANNIPVTPLAA